MRHIYITNRTLGPANNFRDAHSINYRRVTKDTVIMMLGGPDNIRVDSTETAEIIDIRYLTIKNIVISR